MKCFAFSGSGENPYVIRLRQGECTPKRKKGKKFHKRIQILFFQTLSAKTAPQPNLVSDVHRAAPLFRENTGILRSWSKTPHFWRSGSETSWAHLSIPTSLLIAPLFQYFLVPRPAYPCAIVQRCASLCTNFSRRRSSSCSWQVWILFITSPSPPSKHTHKHRVIFLHIKLLLLKSDSVLHDADSAVFYC